MSTPTDDETPRASITDLLVPLPAKTTAAPAEPEDEDDEAPAGVSVRQLVIWCGPPLVVAGGVGLALVSTWALVIGLVVSVLLALAAWRWRDQLAKAWGSSTSRGSGAGGGWGWRGGRSGGAGGHRSGGAGRRSGGAGRQAGSAGGRRPGGARGAIARARQALTPAGIKRGAKAAAAGARTLVRRGAAGAKSVGQRAAAKLRGRQAASAGHGAGGSAGGRGSRRRPGGRRPTSAGEGKPASTTSAGGKRTRKDASGTSAGGAGAPAGDATAPAGAGAGDRVLDGDDSRDWDREPRYWWRRNVARAGDLWWRVATAVGDEARAGASGRVVTALTKPFEGLFTRKPPVDEAEPAPVVEAPVVEAPVVEAPVVEAPVVEAPDTVWRMPSERTPIGPRYIEPSPTDTHAWRFSDATDVPKPRSSVDASASRPERSPMSSAILDALIPKVEEASTPQTKVALLTDGASTLRNKAATKIEEAEALEATARGYEARKGFDELAENYRREATALRSDAETYVAEAGACDDAAAAVGTTSS